MEYILATFATTIIVLAVYAYNRHMEDRKKGLLLMEQQVLIASQALGLQRGLFERTNVPNQVESDRQTIMAQIERIEELEKEKRALMKKVTVLEKRISELSNDLGYEEGMCIAG